MIRYAQGEATRKRRQIDGYVDGERSQRMARKTVMDKARKKENNAWLVCSKEREGCEPREMHYAFRQFLSAGSSRRARDGGIN